MPKYTLEIGTDAERQLDRISIAKGTSKAEILRRALATYVYLSDEALRGHIVTVQDSERNKVRELVML